VLLIGVAHSYPFWFVLFVVCRVCGGWLEMLLNNPRKYYYTRCWRMSYKKHICPNGCGDEFFTPAHIMQEWKVDAFGNFISVAEECLQVTHHPHDDNTWTCAVCGQSAVMVDAEPEGGDGHE
jgi:ribosomal protein S27AE